METFIGNAFEALGEWQFTHHKDRTFVGVLNFSPTDGLELRVVDPTHNGFIQTMFASEPSAKRVCASGRTHSHGHISLFDGFVRSTPSSSHGPTETIYFFNRGLLGLAVPDASEQKFSSVFATSDLLRVWLDQKIVEYNPKSMGSSVQEVRHTLPKPIEIQVDSNKTLTLAWDRRGPNLHLAQSSVEISSRPWIGVEFAQPQGVNRALAELGSATRLISLLSGFEFVPSLTQLRLTSAEAHHGPIYFLASRKQINDQSRKWTPMDLLFTFPTLETRFKDLSVAWFELQRALSGCLNMYFSAHYSAYTNQRLFALTTALEALHRHITKAKTCKLRNRIKESLDRISILIPDVIGNSDAFAKRIVACRNNEAHGGEDDEGGSGTEYVRLASKLRVIIDTLIMMELGLTISEVSTAMRNSNEYWFYASNTTWPWDVND
ncbi:MAG TPA: HEPN domain-containing protein [Tepidisphaeraceae bacterium]|jgi:hypothetical protein